MKDAAGLIKEQEFIAGSKNTTEQEGSLNEDDGLIEGTDVSANTVYESNENRV